MQNNNYYIGLDIGTDSVGYAVTDESYNLCKFKGEPMWGVTLFDPAEQSSKRRTFRAARRRLDRRQQRVKLIMDLFAEDIYPIDANFFKRIKESYLYPTDESQKVRLFGSYKEQKAYTESYPTIHDLIVELMKNPEPHDPRLVYIACAWLVAHRGHFLNEVDKQSIDKVTDFDAVWQRLCDHITRENHALPWELNLTTENIQKALTAKLGIQKKQKELTNALFGNKKAPKEVSELYEYNYSAVIKLLCGGKDQLQNLFGKEKYSELEEKSITLNMDDEKLAAVMQSIVESEAELISILKAIYDWSVLVDILKGKKTISEAKVEVYKQHERDLKALKQLIKKYIPEKYDDVFRSETVKNNYVSYIGKNKTANIKTKPEKTKKEDFCKYINSILKSIKPKQCDEEVYNEIVTRLEINDFMPKQVDGDNRVIPYQLYWFELNKILNNAKSYIKFLNEKDEDGITGAEKILSVFEFRVPYYVGPLKEKSNPKLNHWMVRKATGKIYPWNFNEIVDLDKSEDAFIRRMTNSCTYLPGEDVLPKNSLIYCAFEVLNEINNIKINGNEIPINVKQEIYNNLFLQHDKVTYKRIKDYLLSNSYMSNDDMMTGIDTTVKSTLKPFRAFRNLIQNEYLSYSDAEKIITRATYSEDKQRFKKWLQSEYPSLPESEVKYISNLKFKEFGRLSRKLLCGIEGAVNTDTGEYMSIIRTMWETNNNLMQLLSDKFDFAKNIEDFSKEYFGVNKKSLSERLDEMYISNSVKRPIIRTLDILKDIVKVKRQAPKFIFIEMARDASEDQKGKRTKTRKDQLIELYDTIDTEDVRTLKNQLEEWGEEVHNKLQSDKIFLYFLQLGKCLYTDKPISLDSVLSGDGTYNVEHIYPRSFVKDDSIINNKILVDSKANGDKSDSYPISHEIQDKMRDCWTDLHKYKLISDEKFKRLIRKTHFTEEEKYEFINRQLVETRQSTKAVATILKELYPDTEIVYVKAGLVSEFRQAFDLLKSRAVNDLHHAKDAYLNIVVGNVWHHKFSKRFYIKNADNNVKPEKLFTHTVKNGDTVIWNGAQDKDKVVTIARKNTAHLTMYSYCKHSGQNGGFFDQNPKKAKKDLIPLKENLPIDIYGGYDKATISGFVLAKYTIEKKNEVSFVPLKQLYIKKFLEDEAFALKYVSEELGGKAKNIEILLNKRIIKIYTMLSLDGTRFCIRGKGSSTEIGLMNMMPLSVSNEIEYYIKKLESFHAKTKKNEKLVWDEKFDGISIANNMSLYKYFIDKLSKWPYCKRKGCEVFTNKLTKHVDDFEALDVFSQTKVLLEILGIFGRIKQANLKDLNESSNSGICSISLNLSNWKNLYTDARIIDKSASGLHETVTENLLDLL